MIVAFGSIIPIQEYRSTFPDNGEHDPYFLALAHTLINMAHIGAEISPSLASGVSVCCEEDRRTSARAYQLYADLKATSSWSDGNKLVDFSVASKSLNGLQGADVLAREAFKHASNLGKRRTRKPVKRLRNRTSFHLWTKECLEYLKSRGGLDNLEALTSWDDGSAALPQFTTFYRDSFGE
jgi:hypothetical protein